MANNTEKRALITKDTIEFLEDILTSNLDGVDIFRTGDNLNTITWEVGELDGAPVYGSIKFTLHKANYDLDDEIEKFESKLEEVELKAKIKAQKQAEKEKKLAEQKAKAEARKNEAALAKRRTEKNIAELKEQLQ